MASGELKTYRSKRDFKKTAEPSGAQQVAPSRNLRFVIQKHAATRLHYDFRLEIGAVFWSWAVTRGPSLDPHEKRLAVETEAHPLDYGDFEGTIPRGQYGGGTVMLWDRGYWAPEPGFEPDKAIKKGELKFVVKGEKINGGYVLVRMKRRDHEKHDNWLLIKHRDQYAIDGDNEGVLAQDKSVASGRTMKEIAEGKGKKPTPFMLRRQTKADAVWHSNKKPAEQELVQEAKGKALKTLPGFIPFELCRAVDKPPGGAGWGHEIKLDGYRMQLRVEDGKARLFTRTGLDWTTKFGAVAAAAAKLGDCIIDGELCALDAEGHTNFSSLQEAISNGKTDKLVYFVFDLLCEGDEDLRTLPLSERKARLERLLRRTPKTIRYVSHLTSAGPAVFEAACKMGVEGIVSKRLDAPYRSGRRETWTKAKCRNGREVVIGGWSEENGRLRSLLVGVQEKSGLRYAGRVGTGFDGDTACKLSAALHKVESQSSPFAVSAPRKERGVHWAKPDLVAEIEFGDITADGVFRHAAFKGLRADKPAKEVVAEKVAAARVTAAKSNKPETIRGVAISSPAKTLWPETKDSPAFSKLALAAYLDSVAEWMLPHIAGRPASIIRAPDGIDKELFFQRHAMKGSSPHITLTQVRGDKQPYVQFDTPEALIAAAQIAAIEIHPWNCQPGAPETPGRLVFDLDPAPDVPFARVIEAAKEMRDRLTAVGLESFCKTTGGKGLHVVTPFAKTRAALEWPEAKAFALEMCRQMAADAPARYLVTMAKKDRVGRIFLDYLRNDRTSTAVAPLSPRARPGAPVSMPLTWGQVKAGLDPMKYTIATAAAAFRKTKPWSDYDEGARPFAPAAKKLLAKR
ncbi:MAG TPA: DNA ligase D [Caulobacterales bacterium]|nr:DNA ligase D [Caulobacterales bacterium]